MTRKQISFLYYDQLENDSVPAVTQKCFYEGLNFPLSFTVITKGNYDPHPVPQHLSQKDIGQVG